MHNISLNLPVSGWWLALGIVLLAGMVAAGLFFWRSTVGNLPDPPAGPVSVEPVAPAPAPAPTPPAVVEKPAPPQEAPVKKTIPVSDLAEQAKVPVAITPANKAKLVGPEKKSAARSAAAAAKTARPAPAVPLVTDSTPLLQQMPREFQHALPPLSVTIHVYSHDESQRILFINNREYRKGSEIEGGVRVEDIVPDGAVLSYRGERFKLSRPR
ncbi:MAG: general secretion pathway protein GspB [Gammaproteobacteria bacterium]|nr:general secretion pathway protein GspB [Gammaproteobacteria bacterium]